MRLMLLILFTLASVQAFAVSNKFILNNQIATNATTTSTKVLDDNQSRGYLLIQNLGTDYVYVKMDSAHSGTEGVKIAPGGNYEPNLCPTNKVYVKAASGTQAIQIIEGN